MRPGAPAMRAPAPRAAPAERWRLRAAALFLAPTLIALAAVAGWPLLRTAAFAFTDATLMRLGDAQWVGLENFRELAADPDWWRSVANTLVFAASSVSLQLVLGLGIALVLARAFPGRGLLRALVLVPWAIPTVVSARIWHWIYHDVYGVLNDGLLRLGWIDAPVAWLASDATAMAALVVADVWKATPFMALLLLAGLSTIPSELYEAAEVDGASPIRRFFSITLPLLSPTLAVALIFRTLDSLRVFDIFNIVLGNQRFSMASYAQYLLIGQQEMGMSSAASVIIFVLIFVFAILYIRTLGVDTE